MTDLRDLAHVAGPSDERAPFTFAAAARVAFSDTDAQGIVYYGRYAPYFDVARVEYFRHLGLTTHAVGKELEAEFVMRHFEITYEAPARFDDLLIVYCRVARVGSSSITFEYAVTDPHEGELLATATQVLVNVDLAARASVRIPDSVRGPIERFEQSAR
jgi:acyl-CoA thioester hydrolase